MTILIINIAEWTLIVIIGLCSTLAFYSSGAYTLLHNFFVSQYPGFGRYLINIIWGFLAAVGIFSVSFRRKGGGRLTWFALIFAAPSILAFNRFNIPELLGFKIGFTTDLAFWQVLVLTVGILIAYLLLNFMRELKLLRLELQKKEADSQDIENISIKSHQILLLALLGALVLTGIVTLVAVNLESLLLPFFSKLPWNVVLVGVVCLLILAIYIYWWGKRHSSLDK
jgi:hypothetical protein